MPEFSVHGRYPLKSAQTARGNATLIVDPEHAPPNDDLFDSYGCYVFVRAWKAKDTTRLTPWYVGKTMGSLRDEIFTPHKLVKIEKLRKLFHRGGLGIFLIVPTGNRGAPAKKVVDQIETYYIREAYGRNPELLNQRKRPQRSLALQGVTNRAAGRRSAAAAAFRTMMMGE